jgi:hypothetical protein
MPELAICPFCGCEPIVQDMLGAWCNNDACAIVGIVFSGGARHWNRRAASGAASGEVAALQRMRAAFHVNMLRAHPDKSHAEIAAEIDRACELETATSSEDRDSADAARWRYIEEHCTTQGGGGGFTLSVFVPFDEEDKGAAIDQAIAAMQPTKDKEGV